MDFYKKNNLHQNRLRNQTQINLNNTTMIKMALLINNNLLKYVQKTKIIKNGFIIWDLLLKIK
jgi:hypothetical protein